ncbi:MAG: ATP-binding protein, partial [Thermoplasmata archaeon]
MVDKDILLRYVYAKLNEAPKLSEMYTKVGGKTLKYRRVFFRLKKYVDEFLGENKTDNRFVVLPGLRGVGKTTLLFQIYEYIEKKGIKRDCILYVPTDELVSFFGAGLKDVIGVFIREIQETSLPMLDKKIFIMIDEAHYDRNWSQVGKIIYDQSKNVFTIFTGSSALG